MSKRHIDPHPSPLPSGRHGLPREYVVRSQRTRLLLAAIEIGGSAGYPAMTVSALIARAGVSRKTFYELFDDREDCFLAAYDLVAERALTEARRVYASARTWTDQLRVTIAWMLRALAAYPHEARFAFVEIFAVGARGLARRDAAMRDFMCFLEPGHAAAPAGVTVPALMPEAIAGALFELVSSRVRQQRTSELPDHLPQLLYCALAPFVGPKRAASAAAPGQPPVLAPSART